MVAASTLFLLSQCSVVGMFLFVIFYARARNHGRRATKALTRSPFGRDKKLTIKPVQVLNGTIDDGEIERDRAVRGIASYSLYGQCAGYVDSLLLSIGNVHKLMPGWTTRVYVANNVPKKIVDRLVKAGSCVVVMGPYRPFGHEGAAWRFLPASCKKPFVSLDADDPFDEKTARDIRRWLASTEPFYLGNYFTGFIPMDAGKWGSRNAMVPDIAKRINAYSETWFGFDEAFLHAEVWPIAKKRGHFSVAPPVPRWIALFLVFAVFLSLVFLYVRIVRMEQRRS